MTRRTRRRLRRLGRSMERIAVVMAIGVAIFAGVMGFVTID